MSPLWSFRCYVSPGGVDEIRLSQDGEGRETQSKFLSRLKILSRKPYIEWATGGILTKDLHRECAGLRVIRFKADNIQQRPLGFRSGESEFTILFWAHEKGGRWVERGACQKALERKEEVKKSKDRTNALWLTLE